MAKYNRKTAVANAPTEVNKMDEKAFKLDPKEELVATTLTTFVTGSYYETEDEIVSRIKEAMAKVDDTEFIAKLALYLRRDANMRSVSHLLAGELASRVSGSEWGKRFYRNIVVRPDDMSEIMAYYYHVLQGGNRQKLPNAMKKGFRNRLESLDAYQIDKYKMKNREISLVDIVNALHPVPNQKNAEAFERLVKEEPLDDLYSSKILEKEKTKAGQNSSEEDRDEAVSDAIRDTLDTNLDNMPIFNLVRNLKSIVENTPDKIDMVTDILRNEDKILHSRMLPYRFALAYNAVEDLKSSASASKVSFEKDDELTKMHVDKVLKALEDAFEISCQNIPTLHGRTAILIDHSGSMRGDSGGHSLMSPFSKATTAMVANLFGVMLMQYQDDVFFGLFGDNLITIDEINRDKGMLENARSIHKKGSKCGGSSEHGLYEFFAEVVTNDMRVDNVFIFSDMVIGTNNWYGRGEVNGYNTTRASFNDLFKDFRKVNPLANVVSVDLKATDGTTVFNKNLNVTQLSGWSNKIFDLMETFSKGYKDLVEEIESKEI